MTSYKVLCGPRLIFFYCFEIKFLTNIKTCLNPRSKSNKEKVNFNPHLN